jgi:serine/threonine protein kinase
MDSDRWQRVARLYDQVLEREPDERAAFLVSQTGDDAELQREVQSLLAQDNERLLLDEPLLETAAEVLDEIDLEAGTQLGPYRIDVVVGPGGMGHVYRATDTRLNRTVAIKVLPHALARDPQRRARASSAKRVRWLLSAIRTSALCTTSGNMKAWPRDNLGAAQSSCACPFMSNIDNIRYALQSLYEGFA